MPHELAPPGAEASVIVVDDDAVARAYLARLLARAGLACRQHASAEEFLDAFDPTQPACVLLDLGLPGMGGAACLDRLVAFDPQPVVVIVSGTTEVSDAVHVLRTGALHLVQKPPREEEILDAVRAALAESASRHALHRKRRELRERLALLTPRERDVYELVVRGATNRDAGAALGIAPKTVEVHRANAMRKLGADSLASLVRLSVDAAGAERDPPAADQSKDAPFAR